ncbi:MAG: bacteriohemerythrin [Candidatus Marinimicrobia bacterium]|nr:bacteriohemerythrin [Candidatus Neomarinimicrobiota bacterium]MCF7850850.1 bacteriohemerythrin [Candidatus Neomarinimicrobiota bacterium]MCF7905105.1 bacteriohemerythrin [Candidatus Neomarinimicrobiota bacterium]
MDKIIWNKQFNVGIKKFDDDHKLLIDMVNDLLVANEESQDQATIVDKINNLIDHTKDHFRAEEQVMKKHNFPGLDDHYREHLKLLGELETFKRELDAKSSVNVEELSSFLTGWLLNHILTMDIAYTAFLYDKGVK